MLAPEYETSVPLPAILEILGVSRGKFFGKLRQELQDAGAIFYLRQWRVGFDGKKRLVKVCRAFPSRLQRWTGVKSAKRDML